MKKNLVIVFLVVCLCALAAFSLYTINGKQEEIASLQQSLTTTQTGLDAANAQLTTLESEKAALQADVENAQANLDSANTQIATLESEKADLQTTVEKTQTNLNAANVQITTLESEKVALQADVENAQANLDSANTQIATLKSENSALQAEFDAAIILKPSVNTLSASQSDFIYVNNGTEVQINGYQGSGGHVVIPNEIDGSTVTRIAPNAFENAKNITGIVLPEKLQYIGDNAFYGLKNLTGIVVIPKTVTEVSGHAFQSTKLTGVVIKGSAKLGVNAFANIGSLEFIYVAESCAPEVGTSVFSYADALTTAVFPSTMIEIKDNTFKGCNSMVIYTPTGSFAEKYANKNFIKVDTDNYAEQVEIFVKAYD